MSAAAALLAFRVEPQLHAITAAVVAAHAQVPDAALSPPVVVARKLTDWRPLQATAPYIKAVLFQFTE